jgi:hypothetical protein
MAPAPEANDEPPSWDKLANDTDNATASADTRPILGNRKAAGSFRERGRRLPAGARLWWVAVGVGVLGIAALILVLWLGFGGKPARVNNDSRPPLVVSRLGANGGPRTLSEAVLRARYGDHIVLTDDITDKDVTVRIGGLTVEPGPGKTVVWRAPEKAPKVERLLHLNAVEDFQIRGITLDGDNRTDTLIQMYGRCPGARLEDLRLKGFTRSGILVNNCEGSPERRAVFDRLHFTTATLSPAQPPPTAIWFTLTENIAGLTKNRFFTIGDQCTFDGPGTKIKVNQGSIESVQFPAGVTPVQEK